MRMEHPIKTIALKNKADRSTGICSVCSSNGFVIEAAIQRARELGQPVLLESTSNQVNQYGGYTGMTPEQFGSYVNSIAVKTGIDPKNVILGGDHLGPNPWKDEPAISAMEKAKALIRDCVLAGYSKIHIDTSMKLGSDASHPSPRLIASRGAELCLVAEKAFEEYAEKHPSACRPVYVIGSEVPVPGGSESTDEEVAVTKAGDFIEAVEIYRQEFLAAGLREAWENVVAFVVQPGVEFGNDSIHPYSREEARDLVNALKRYPIVFEGHSTDYQSVYHLKQMVEDGICILKVGPALTFAMREGLLMLEMIEKELLTGKNRALLSNFSAILEETMLGQPKYWEKYYPHSPNERRLAIKYSYSDRCRYYMDFPQVKKSVETLLRNLDEVNIPDTLISQYMPLQYKPVREGRLSKTARCLLIDKIRLAIDDYYYATGVLKGGSL